MTSPSFEKHCFKIYIGFNLICYDIYCYVFLHLIFFVFIYVIVFMCCNICLSMNRFVML